MANAQATLLGKVNVEVVGSSQDVEKITSAFTSGMSGSKFLDGMFAGAGVDALAMLKGIGGKLSGLADAATGKLAGASEDLAVTEPAPSTDTPSKAGHADGNNTGSQRS